MNDEHTPGCPLINPFAAAMKKPRDIEVAVRFGDVKHLVPNWSDEQAADFLARHAEVIATAMLARAVESILILLQKERSHDELQ